jgi:integrase
MTVVLPKGAKTYRYDFEWKGKRYTGSTHQIRRDDAEIVESQIKLRLRQEHAGIAPFDPSQTPRFAKWAGVYERAQKRYITRPDIVHRTLEVVLEFWGAKPKTPKKAPAVKRPRRVEAPYHDLRLGDPIADPSWLVKFQRWIDARGVSGQTRNTYLSALSGMYKLALQPEHRGTARVSTNPFADVRRSPPRRRLVALEPDQVMRWIAAAPYHVALATTIAALAPKMRLQTILQLQWREHFDAATTRIVVQRHKTASRTGLPQVTPLSLQLQEILRAARQASTSDYVITFHGHPVKSIKKAARRAAEDVGLAWGVQDGVTFHTIRHSVATILATLGLAERLRMELLGHKEIRTTQQYTHLAASSQIDPHEQLSAVLPLKTIVLAKTPARSKATGRRSA